MHLEYTVLTPLGGPRAHSSSPHLQWYMKRCLTLTPLLRKSFSCLCLSRLLFLPPRLLRPHCMRSLSQRLRETPLACGEVPGPWRPNRRRPWTHPPLSVTGAARRVPTFLRLAVILRRQKGGTKGTWTNAARSTRQTACGLIHCPPAIATSLRCVGSALLVPSTWAVRPGHRKQTRPCRLLPST